MDELKLIKDKIEKCIHIFYENDLQLLEKEIHENAVSAQLSRYLAAEFPNYHIDCEYNRHLEDDKELDGEIIRPDIVIHRRATDDQNLAYIEIKTNKNKTSRKNDINKIRGATRQNGEFRYKIGVLIDFTLADVRQL